MSKTAQIIIKSCDRRVLELEQVKAWLTGNGFQLSGNHFEVDPKADLIILTTCGVTQLHEDFTFKMLDQIMAKKKTGAKVILGGCVPEINPKRVSEEFDGPTFSPKSYHKLDEILNLPQRLEHFERPNLYKMRGLYRSDVGNMLDTVKYVSSLDLHSMIRGLNSRVRNRRTYYIQIHEGCSMGCTYCAIQKAIGPLRNSKPIVAVIEELNEGIGKGYKHIRLIGDCAGSYGLDIGTNLGELLWRISEVKKHFRLELTDINPVFLPIIYQPVKELCLQKRLSNLYIPIQSGNERILGLMNRRCDMNRTRQMLIDLKEAAPQEFKLGTSVIVGFPSETNEELKDTIHFCNDLNFDWIYCHGFSARPGTPAATLPGQLSEEEVTELVNLFKESIKEKESVILDFQ